MKVYTDWFEFNTKGEFDMVDLTERVKASVERSGVQEGMALVYAGHSTGALVLNEDEPGLIEDIKALLRNIVSTVGDYSHQGNAFAHLRQLLLTTHEMIPVSGGRPGLGTWQNIYWVETERRPRQRRVEVVVIGEQQIRANDKSPGSPIYT